MDRCVKLVIITSTIMLCSACSTINPSGSSREANSAASFDNSTFNSKSWIDDKNFAREIMVRDLIESKILIGKSPDEVKKLLGKADQEDANGLLYEIRPSNGDFETLIVKFKEGKVVSCESHFNP
ncbi:MAG TPA: hypothetical protein V6C76_07580 [Drouetiella sp.]